MNAAHVIILNRDFFAVFLFLDKTFQIYIYIKSSQISNKLYYADIFVISVQLA